MARETIVRINAIGISAQEINTLMSKCYEWNTLSGYFAREASVRNILQNSGGGGTRLRDDENFGKNEAGNAKTTCVPGPLLLLPLVNEDRGCVVLAAL